MMQHRFEKKCRDDMIMVDTSSGPSRGCWMTVAIVRTMKGWLWIVRRWSRLAWFDCCWIGWH